MSTIKTNTMHTPQPELATISTEQFQSLMAASMEPNIAHLSFMDESPVDLNDLQRDRIEQLRAERRDLVNELVFRGDIDSLFRGEPLDAADIEAIAQNPEVYMQTVMLGFANRARPRSVWSSYAPLGQTVQSFASLEASGRPHAELQMHVQYDDSGDSRRCRIYSKMQGRYEGGYIGLKLEDGEITASKHYWQRGTMQEDPVTDVAERDALVQAVLVDVHNAYRTYDSLDDALARQAATEPL